MPSSERAPFTLSVTPLALARVLGWITGFFVVGQLGVIAAHYTGHYIVFGLVPLLDLNEELNLPSFFSLLLLLGASLVSALHLAAERAGHGRARFGWALLTFGFLYMALDEAFSFHERLLVPTRLLFGGAATGLLYYTWVIPGIAIVLSMGVALLPLLRSLDARTLRRYLFSGALYLGGSIVIEMFEGRWDEGHGRDVIYDVFVLFEETGEMLGIVLFIRWSLDHLCQRTGKLRLQFETKSIQAAAGEFTAGPTEADMPPALQLELLTSGRDLKPPQVAADVAARATGRASGRRSEVA